MGKISDFKQVNIEELRPYENNSKIHTPKQIEELKKSISEFGFIAPVVIDANKNVIAGHGRIEAAKELSLDTVPCVIAEDLSDDQRKAYIILDNKLAELSKWDMEKVASELEDLSDFDFDISGFDLPELDNSSLYYGDERERTYNAYNLNITENVKYTNDYWQMPIIKAQNTIPDRLVGFNYAKTSKEKSCGIHCFIDDYQIERLWNDPDKYVDILKEYQCFLTPDYSLYLSMPMPMKIWNIYRSRMIGAYYQTKGIKVIPTISWAEKETFDFAFSGIQEGASVAISTIGVKENKNSNQIWVDGIKEMINRIKPKTILEYGGEIGFDYGNINVIHFSNEVLKRWK